MGFVYNTGAGLTRQILCTRSRKWAVWRMWQWTRGSLWSGSWPAWWPLFYGSGWEPLPPSEPAYSLPGRRKHYVISVLSHNTAVGKTEVILFTSQNDNINNNQQWPRIAHWSACEWYYIRKEKHWQVVERLHIQDIRGGWRIFFKYKKWKTQNGS